MFLPPFYGIPNKYDEPSIKEAMISYLVLDISTSLIPTSVSHATYLQSDVCILKDFSNTANSSFLVADVLVFDSAGGSPSIPTNNGGDTGSSDSGSSDTGSSDSGSSDTGSSDSGSSDSGSGEI